jgi:hypothetical protein
MLLNFLLTWLVAAISLMITAYFVPGFEIASWTAAAIAAIILELYLRTRTAKCNSRNFRWDHKQLNQGKC